MKEHSFLNFLYLVPLDLKRIFSLSIENIIADRDLLKRLIARFRELDPDADRIIQMRLNNPKISDRKIAEALGRPQRTFADQMKRYYTELHKEKNK